MGRFILKIKKNLQISSDLTPVDLGENELTINIKTEPWKTHIAYVTKRVLVPDYGERFHY